MPAKTEIQWGALFYEIRHKVAELNQGDDSVVNGAKLNLHPENAADFMRSEHARRIYIDPNDGLCFMGITLQASRFMPEGMGMLIKDDRVRGTVNFDTGMLDMGGSWEL